MLDFLLDEPYFLILVLYGLYRFLRGSKETEKAAKERARQAAPSRASTPPAGGDGRVKTPLPGVPAGASLEERLQRLALQWERKLSGAVTGTAEQVAVPAAAVASPAAPIAAASDPVGSEPFAEAAVSEQVVERDGGNETRSNFDARLSGPEQAAVVAADMRESAFAFREPTRLATTALAAATSSVPRSAVPVPQSDAIGPDESAETPPLLSSSDEIARAIVLSEILGRPRALRPWPRSAGAV